MRPRRRLAIGRRPDGLRDADVAWTEERAIAIMRQGVPFVDAAQIAAIECTDRVLAREARFQAAVQEERDTKHRKRLAKQAEEDAARRASLEAKATLGQKPTLTASLGDLLVFKKR